MYTSIFVVSNIFFTYLPLTSSEQIYVKVYSKQWRHTRGIDVQGGAEETHVFHIRITSFIFNIKSFNCTKRRYFNAFLKYVPNYVRKIMSVRWRPSCQTHIRSLSSKSCFARSNIFCGTAAISWRMEGFSASIVRCLFVYTLHDRSGSSKCFNPTEYSVSIWNCTSTLNIELPTEKTLDSNYGIAVSKTCSTANTRCCTFQYAMATETALSELSAGSRPTSSTPPLPSTSYLKKCVSSALPSINLPILNI
jgi:hypothetical protein